MLLSHTKRIYIGKWVAVKIRVVETKDSRGARVDPIIPYHMYPIACIHNRTPVDGYGKWAPKTSFMKACNGH